MPDPQKNKVYKAETILPDGKRFSEVPEVQAYVDRLLGERWFRKLWPGWKRIEVRDGRRRRRAASFGSMIKMPRWSRCEKYVLHEIAHSVTAHREHHGPEFCRNMIRLVEGVYGRHTAMLFEGALRGREAKVAPER